MYTATLTIGEDEALGIVIEDDTLDDRDLLELLYEMWDHSQRPSWYQCPICSANLSSAALAWSHFRLVHGERIGADDE